MSSIKRLWNKVVLLGFSGLVCCVLSRLFFALLRMYFGFAKWHAIAPICCRPYKRKVADIIHALGSKGVVEVGCGLGDIGRLLQKISDVDYYGIDLDSGVISGARFLAGKKSHLAFKKGGLEQLKQLSPGRFDTLLLLNWPHEIDTKSLTEMVASNVSRDIRYVLMDSIKQNAVASFRYRHTHEKLAKYGFAFRLKKTINDLDEVRDLMLFER